MPFPARLMLATSILAAAAPAVAQPALYDEASGADGGDIVVTGAITRDQEDSSSPVSIVAGAELQRALRPQIGDALISQPGVSTSSFGPNASRPILRGLSGERVRILTDGIGAFDVSNTSADHAVAIDPLLAERIEVLRGPASLRFGSSAIGGVVNVLDARIPTLLPDRQISIQTRAVYASGADERSGGANAALLLADRFVLSAGGSLTDTDDLRVGGALLSSRLRDIARASGDPDVRALADLSGRLPNSGSRTRTANLGAAFIDDGNDIGLSLSRYESVYGLPVRFDLTPGAEQEAVSIDAEQWRTDVRAGVAIPGGMFDRLSVRAGYADYAHVEREGDGGVGTLFANEGIEGRVELRQRRRGGWQGVSGIQYFFRDFLAVGAEAFVPPNDTEQVGMFTVQEVDLGPVRLELGGRIERTSIRSVSAGFDRHFTARSIAAGAFVPLTSALRFGLNLSSTARAPAAEELLANGPHVGTQTYEIGDPAFGIERARGIELVGRFDAAGLALDVALYRTRFANYIYEFETGEVREDLPVFQFAQGRATYHGIEVEARATLIEQGRWSLSVDAIADAVRARIAGFGPAPRIPPLRLLGGIEARSDRLGARIEVEHAARQERVTGFETPTPSFTLANVSFDWTPWSDRDLRLTLSAANLFDTLARRHASFLKEYAPLPGRDIRVGFSAPF